MRGGWRQGYALVTWAILGLGVGCTRPNESHCGNQMGDVTCAARDAARPYCNRCEAINDGCVAQPVTEPGCGEGSDAGSSSTVLGTTAEDDTTVDSTGSPCGNGVIDAEEVCDGPALPSGADCSTEGFGEGVPGCASDCSELDYSTCPAFVGCGDGLVGNGEECDGTNLSNRTCSSFEGYKGPGLACADDCTFDLSLCTVCLLSGAECMPGQVVCCDSNDMCSGLVTKTCCQGAACL